MTDPESEQGSSAAVRKLAERYGITVEDMEKLIGATKTSANSDTEPTTLPPVEAKPLPQQKPVPPTDQAASAKPAPPTILPLRPAVPTKAPLSGGFLAAIVTALIIALAVAFSFQRGCFRQRSQRIVTSAIDSIPQILRQQADSASMPPETPSQTAPSQVPPEALTVPQESPPGTTGPTPPKSVLAKEQQDAGTVSTASAHSLETSSNFAAQEKLAELRANGFSRAKIQILHRHGLPVYRVSPH